MILSKFFLCYIVKKAMQLQKTNSTDALQGMQYHLLRDPHQRKKLRKDNEGRIFGEGPYHILSHTKKTKFLKPGCRALVI
jgi:hypothetical protein